MRQCSVAARVLPLLFSRLIAQVPHALRHCQPGGDPLLIGAFRSCLMPGCSAVVIAAG